MSTPAGKTAVVVGVGPGLGLSIARRFGREGYTVALISRTDARHAEYLSSLAEDGIVAEAFVADVQDRDRILSVLEVIDQRLGPVDLLYYGPGAADPDNRPKSILETSADDVREGMLGVYPAVDVASWVLPGMIERGGGGLLFAGGLSAVQPMPALGALAVTSAALRNYALTLNAGLAEKGIYAGTLTIGGLIERGDIHQLVKSRPEQYGDVGAWTLDPDEIADTAWRMYTERDRPEVTFSAFG